MATLPQAEIPASNRVHIYPINDTMEHDTASQNCLCMPDVKVRDDGAVLIIHHAQDGRNE